MISIYFATGIFCAVGIWINYLKRRKGVLVYGIGECLLLCIITRIFPIFMYQEHTITVIGNLIIDAAMLTVVSFVLYKKSLPHKVGNVSMLLILNPAVILCIVSEQYWKMLLVIIVVALALAVGKRLKKVLPDFSLAEFYPEYIAITAGLFFIMIATGYLKQNLAQCLQTDGEVPMVLILSIALFLIGEICACFKILHWHEGAKRFSSIMARQEVSLEGQENPVATCALYAEHGAKLSRKDALLIISITAIYAALVLFNLGSSQAPETNMRLAQDNDKREIILEFGEYVYVSDVKIYLGYEGNRNFAFSYPDAQTNQWKVFKDKYAIESAFDWNTIEVEGEVSALGVVLLDEEAYINEIVILDKSGKRLLPLNAAEYKSLFDEQQLYPHDTTFYYGTMFDEVYHARTAYEFVNGLPIYETTHPPLGKSLIGIGIKIFGMNPLGWRCICALFGILMIPLTYMFAWRISRRTMIAASATILMCTEFMHFTLSRIATLDIIVACFILMMFYFMYCFIDNCRSEASLKRQVGSLILCGIATACAIATKWIGFYAAAGLVIILAVFLISHFRGKRLEQGEKRQLKILFITCVGAFIALPCAVYVLSYIPFTQLDSYSGLIRTALDNSKSMLQYHAATVTPHPYESQWYEWIIDRKSLLDALTYFDDGKVSTVSTLGNPLIVWGGLISLLHNVYLWRCQRNDTSRFLCLAYVSMLAPWLFIFRTVFIYQYFVCILIFVLMIGNSMYNMKRHRKRNIIIITGISVALFILYYPAISGYSVPTSFIKQVLELFSSWRFA